jgi:hypothetical protein
MTELAPISLIFFLTYDSKSLSIMKKILTITFIFILIARCSAPSETSDSEKKIQNYRTVRLTTDLSVLTEKEKQMIPILIEIGKIMDDLFWYEAYGGKDKLLTDISDPATRDYININYGPWDRLNGNEPFLKDVGAKPPGANFYPADITREEFEASELPDKKSLYTFIRRDEDGELISIPYKEMFKEELTTAVALLRQCAKLAEDQGLKDYLTVRSDALLTDIYQPSDMAWMDMKTNTIDFIVGPIENYEDKLYGYKTAHEAYVLVKDKEWSNRLSKYAGYLQELQAGLPVPEEYKTESAGKDADLNAYDVVYYAGDCNSGSKTIAINLPNDEEVQASKGSRRLQLKNVMRAKFDHILVPVSNVLIAEDQRKHITFDAFFGNTMFHEVAHGLGVRNTINDQGTVRNALKEHATSLEEGKADVLGLYMIGQLHEKGEIDRDMMDHYVTFLASILRSVRFGAASSHGKATMIRFNFFKEFGAFTKDEETNTYRVNPDKMKAATNALSENILRLQGDGDYYGVASLVKEQGVMGESLRKDLDRLLELDIPLDLVFEQGVDVLGL